MVDKEFDIHRALTQHDRHRSTYTQDVIMPYPNSNKKIHRRTPTGLTTFYEYFELDDDLASFWNASRYHDVSPVLSRK
jgi:hypothetical protein